MPDAIDHCIRCNRVCPRSERPLGICTVCCIAPDVDEGRIDSYFDRDDTNLGGYE